MKKLYTNTLARAAAYPILVLSSLLAALSLIGLVIALDRNYFFLSGEGLARSLRNYDIASQQFYRFIYDYRYMLIILTVTGVLLCLAIFIFILLSAGHRKNLEGLHKGWLTHIPLDLLTFLAGFLLFIFFAIGTHLYDWELLVYLLFAYPFAVCLTTAFLGDLALRIKLGKWWENTLLLYSLTGIKKTAKALFSLFLSFLAALPLLWKALLILGALSVCEIIFIWFSSEMARNGTVALLMLWLGEKILFYPVICYLILVLRQLQASGRQLAAGNLTHYTDTSKMFWDFKEHGENLNSIAIGMSRAVEDRLKSERLKTELITNVSHDIKTPLTSIINYSDLIAKETIDDNPKLKEYASALHRQSGRLKKLLEDLLDASKVSAGNVEIHLAACETDVLLTQAVGEYEEKLKQQGLELIVKQPEKSLKIMVDGRHIWRVFDNLMNNVCKYAQTGTRVYLTLEEKESRAVFSIKNTSHQPLDLSADELMERFVRGDRSRHTEGSGLGLSIAQSLTLLQKGQFTLMIDGDFFKVTLSFALFSP